VRRVVTWTKGPVDREGAAVYVHLIRAPYDPQRRKRYGKQGILIRPDKTVSKVPVDEWTRRLLALLADGEKRTFNRIAMDLISMTADVAFNSTLDRALWGLVAEGKVEHTIEAPILFRLARA
jgi:hypothetical protein